MTLRTLLPALLLAAPLVAAEPVLHTDLAQAKALAAREHKNLLLDFTGSQWCPYCVLLQREVLATPEFARFAEGCVLVKLDFPPSSGRSPEKIKADPALSRLRELKATYRVTGFPTVVLLGPDGTERARAQGYAKGMGPAAYLAKLK